MELEYSNRRKRFLAGLRVSGPVAVMAYAFKLSYWNYRLFGIRNTVAFLRALIRSLAQEGYIRSIDGVGPAYCKIHNSKVVFLHPHIGFMKEVIIDECYNSIPGFEIGKDAVVIDAGANVGEFTILAAVLAKNGKVISLEPELSRFRFLTENIDANKLKNVIPLNLALSDESGTGTLYVGDHTSIVTSEHALRHQSCQCITINELLSRYSIDHVNFLKVDIEGAEFAVFRNSEWLDRVEAVAMETHPLLGNVEKLVSIFVSRGFKVISKGNYLYAKKKTLK
jgi:FkbM family methyltransferase